MKLSAETRRALAYSLACCAVLYLSGSVFTYVRNTNNDGNPTFWLTSSIPVHMVLNVGSSWAGAAQGALNDWNDSGSNFRFTYHTTSQSQSISCESSDDRNVVVWSSTDCGMAWSPTTLAITQTWSYTDGQIASADVYFNSNKTWDVYNGDARSGGVVDFRRVALHEFGHVLGLDHPDDHGQSRNAVMNARHSDTYTLQADDVNGAVAIYGGTARPIPPTGRCTLASLGTVSGTVTRNGTLGRDCVSPNYSGKLARYYSFRLAQAADVRIDMVSSDFDSYLVLRRGANIGGSILAFDDDEGAGTNARISTRLQAGTYTIEATSYAQDDTGQFRLTLTATPVGSTAGCTLASLGTVSGTVTRNGTLGRDCVSPNYSGELARYYSFRLAQTADVRIDMTSSNINSWLTLRQGANIRGSQVAADDDGGTGNNARISTRLQAGTYTIEATSYAAGDTGQFRLTLTATPVGSTAGCTLASLGTVSGTVTRNGTLGRDCVSPNYSGELARYYSFRLAQTADVRIDLTLSDPDSGLTLRRGANIRGSQLAAAFPSPDGIAHISRRLQAGTYTIEVRSLGLAARGESRRPA